MNFTSNNQHFWKPFPEALIKHENMNNIIENWDDFKDLDWLWQEINGFMNIKLNYVKDPSKYKKIKNMNSFSCFGKGNIIEKIVDTNVDIKGNQNALQYRFREQTKDITFEGWSNSLSKVVCSLKEIGFKKGDRAIIAMPFIPEGLISFLGVIKMGGVSVPLLQDFTQEEVEKIINTTRAKVLFTVDADLDASESKIVIKNKIDAILKNCPTVEVVIVVNSFREEISWKINRDAWWDDLIESQQLLEPVDTTNTGEPHMILYLQEKKTIKKKNMSDEVNLFSTFFDSIKESNLAFTQIFVLILLFLYNYKLETT